MSETQAPVDFNTVKVTRNGVTKTLTEQIFGKKSPHAGKKFPAPEFSSANIDEGIVWIGKEEVAAMASTYLRRIFADLYVDSVEENEGKFILEKFLEDAADFTAGVAKLSDLQEEIDQLLTLQQTYVVDENFGATAEDGTPTPEAVALVQKMKEVSAKIKPLKIQIAGIKEVYKQRAAKRAKKEAVKEAPTAPVVVSQ